MCTYVCPKIMFNWRRSLLQNWQHWTKSAFNYYKKFWPKKGGLKHLPNTKNVQFTYCTIIYATFIYNFQTSEYYLMLCIFSTFPFTSGVQKQKHMDMGMHTKGRPQTKNDTISWLRCLHYKGRSFRRRYKKCFITQGFGLHKVIGTTNFLFNLFSNEESFDTHRVVIGVPVAKPMMCDPSFVVPEVLKWTTRGAP